jgi:hypothetical protein
MFLESATKLAEHWNHARHPADQPDTPRSVFLVEPTGFRLSAESASDNVYMDLAQRADPERAMAQHRALAETIRRHARMPVHVFAGDVATPDAVFPNNVFATGAGRVIVGAMRHADRQREAARTDIAEKLARVTGYPVTRLAELSGVVAELTGPLVIDRARAVGWCGLTERCNPAGARAMHEAFGLRLTCAFPLVAGEYHTNVVMAVLAGRALVVHAPSLADPDAVEAIARVYAPHVIRLDDSEKAAFAGNCIALRGDQAWMSARAERALTRPSRDALERAGFVIHTVEIDEIEKAGGSLRCCIGEIF